MNKQQLVSLVAALLYNRALAGERGGKIACASAIETAVELVEAVASKFPEETVAA